MGKNPNDLEIPVRGIDYTIILMGDSFAEGVSNDQFLLPAKGEAEFDMLVTANAATALIKLATRGGLKKGAIDYRISGSLSTSLGFLRKVPFEEKGQIRLNEPAVPATPAEPQPDEPSQEPPV